MIEGGSPQGEAWQIPRIRRGLAWAWGGLPVKGVGKLPREVNRAEVFQFTEVAIFCGIGVLGGLL